MIERARRAFITTSWDDGHPLDLRLASLLTRYNLPATFYIPRQSQRPTLSVQQIRELSDRFEIGAHTMSHVYLDSCSDGQARDEIDGCKKWVEDVTGKPCPMFCPPAGKFFPNHLEMIETAGFQALRTVELLSLSEPNRRGRLMMIPTTLQAHDHRQAAYFRNFARRRALKNFWLYLLHGAAGDWESSARKLVQRITQRGGVFHLWGHSWEIERNQQWGRLEQVFRLLGDLPGSIQRKTNGQLCEMAAGKANAVAIA